MAPFEALCGRKNKSPIGCFEVGESSLLDPKLIHKILDKVHIQRNFLKTSYNRQKSYADRRRRDLTFQEGDKLYLKVLPMKGKLSPGYVGPEEILQRVGKIAYDLKLPSELTSVYLVFYFSMLKKCVGDPSRFFLLRD